MTPRAFSLDGLNKSMKEGNRQIIAITRNVSSAIEKCELTHLPRIRIDLSLATAQHRMYERALGDLGCMVVTLPASTELPDSVFVEDTAVVLDELSIICRPGVSSRRPETEAIARTLSHYRPLNFIEQPGTLEGGDVLRVKKLLYVGLSTRTNEAGIGQLRTLVAPFGYSVKSVYFAGCLHLKSAITRIGTELLLINSQWVSRNHFEHADFIEVDPEEPSAANALAVGGTVIYPASFPRTRKRMEERGIAVMPVDISELQKAEAAVTCCSLLFMAQFQVD